MKEKIKQIIIYFWNGILGKMFWIFPIDHTKIVCCSYRGYGYGDNPKYIAEEIHRRAPEYKIIWIVRDTNNDSFPDWIRLVKIYTIGQLYSMATAGIWVDNCRKHRAIKRRKNQKYIQTWHGSMALKKIEGDVTDKLTKNYVKNAVQDTKNATLFISNGTWCTEMYRRAFWYKGEIMECGSPRVDILFNMKDEKKYEIRKKIKIPDGAKIAIYAPTFRVDKKQKAYTLDYELLRNSLSERFGGDWYILLRLHPNLIGMNMRTDNEFTIEVTNYPDMYELLAISDVLITDYSSTMFEMGYSGKPVFLFATDIDEYSDDRGFYFSFDELPYILSKNNDELCSNILKFDENNYSESLLKFHQRCGIIEDGHASERLADHIIKMMN